MRKYIGSKFTIYAAIVLPLFVLAPLVFAVIALDSEISPATFFLAFGCLFCSVSCILYIKQVSAQLYTWVRFRENGIEIKTALSKKYIIDYSKCRGIGIGFYIHGFLNSNVGMRVCFIYFSYEPFDEEYRNKINLWKPSNTRVKVEFDIKLYNYLLTVLSPKQAVNLQRDYEKYIGQKNGSQS